MKNMKKLNKSQMTKVEGGLNVALCFDAGFGSMLTFGPAWSIGLVSINYAAKCFNAKD
jgi:hypothetical protein